MTMNKGIEQMEDTIKIIKKKPEYSEFTCNRMTAYIKGVSHEQKKLPFSTKKDLDYAFEMIKEMQQVPAPASRKFSELNDDFET